MPVVKSLMENLQRQYGEEAGKNAYYAMEASGKGPFAPGGKHRDMHEAFAKKNGVPPSLATRSKKPAGQKARRARKARR